MPPIPLANRLLPLLLLALAAGGCDSTDDALRLDADFYVGTWTLTSVADDTGDRTTEVNALVDDLRAQFDADRTFSLDADFFEVVNAAGLEDVAIDGTYQAQAEARALVLLVPVEGQTLAPTFQVDAASEDAITLTAPAAIVTQLLTGPDGTLELDFSGNVVLGIARQ